MPSADQTSRYAATNTHVGTKVRSCRRFPACTRANVRIIGAAVGNMMATIIATQMARNNGAPIPIVGIIAVAASTVSACHTSSAQAAAASMSNRPRMRLRSRGSG